MNFKFKIKYAIIPLVVCVFFIARQALALDLSGLQYFGADASVSGIIGNVIKGILGITGSFALFMMVYGGMIMLTAAGDTGKIDKGKKIINWAIIGIIIVMSSYAIISYVQGVFLK